MSKIKILDPGLNELATITVASSAVRTERINSDNTLDFTIRVKSGLAEYINESNLIELDGDYFDIAYFKKEQQEDGTLLVSVECEHVSYRLNDQAYNVEYFTNNGTPAVILSSILNGTGFTADTVEFDEITTFSLQESASRRALLMQFAAYLKGELEFSGFTISLLKQRGSSTPKAITVGKDVTVISKEVNKREPDSGGNPTVSYVCGVYKGASFDLGDVVSLRYPALDIDTSLRVLSKSYDPFNPNSVTIEVGNFVSSLENDLYRIETNAVKKDALMNGIRIGPEYGFEAVRNDKKARAYFRSDEMKFQSGDGSGSSWKDRLYYDYDSETGDSILVFNGKLSAELINALSAIITPNLYAEKATISELTVDRLDTSDKVQNYLRENTDDDNFQRIYDQFHEFITASTTGEETVQAKNRNGKLLYWTDDNHAAAATTETPYPVMTYVYDETAKMRLGFGVEPSSGFYYPMIELGIGSGSGKNGKGYIYKGVAGLYLDYYSNTGELRRVLLGNDGISLTPYALEKLDFYDNGFSAVYSGENVSYTWELDLSGRITKLIAEDNSVVNVNWHSGGM